MPLSLDPEPGSAPAIFGLRHDPTILSPPSLSPPPRECAAERTGFPNNLGRNARTGADPTSWTA
jgi:hypothetical protein